MARKPTKQQQIDTLTKQLNEAQVALHIQETAHEVQLSKHDGVPYPLAQMGTRSLTFCRYILPMWTLSTMCGKFKPAMVCYVIS